MWGSGERWLSFAGKTGTDSVVHTHPYLTDFEYFDDYDNFDACFDGSKWIGRL
jgi:hypothetical protein